MSLQAPKMVDAILKSHPGSQRDHLIRRLHAEGHSYGQLALAIGCSRDLVAKVVQRSDDSSRAV